MARNICRQNSLYKKCVAKFLFLELVLQFWINLLNPACMALFGIQALAGLVYLLGLFFFAI